MSEEYQIRIRRGNESDLPATLAYGEPAFTGDTGKLFVGKSDGSKVQIGGSGGGAVTSVAGRTGAVVLTEADVTGLVADLAAEATARAAAVTAEATTRAAADTTNATAITSEATTRAAADTTNATAITTEATNRATAVTNEATTRASADTTNATAITNEVTRATAAEALKADKTITVNGHAINANVVVSATDITTGTLAAARVATLNQNTTGSAASLSAASALPNNTTATTQATADNTTKLATTALVQAAITAALAAYVPPVPAPVYQYVNANVQPITIPAIADKHVVIDYAAVGFANGNHDLADGNLAGQKVFITVAAGQNGSTHGWNVNYTGDGFSVITFGIGTWDTQAACVILLWSDQGFWEIVSFSSAVAS